MPDDVTALLERTAITPSAPVDPSSLQREARRRDRRARVAAAVGVVSVAALAIPAAISLRGHLAPAPDPAFIVTDPADNPAWPVSLARTADDDGVPSQTPEEAARDQVPAELAAVPLGVRAPGGMSLDLADGRRWQDGPGSSTLARPWHADCVPETLCGGDYYEFQLMSPDGDLELAHALPGVQPDWISLGPDGALYGADQPDSPDADAVIFRLGTTPGDRTVRVLPGHQSWYSQDGDPASPLRIDGTVWLPDGWIIDSATADRSHFDTNSFSWDDGRLVLTTMTTDVDQGTRSEQVSGPRYILDAQTLERLDTHGAPAEECEHPTQVPKAYVEDNRGNQLPDYDGDGDPDAIAPGQCSYP